MSKMAWEAAKKAMETKVVMLMEGVIISSTDQLMTMNIKELEQLKREVFKQWDRLGAIITLKTMDGENYE